MIYLTSIPIVIFLLFLTTLLGRRIADFLPESIRKSVGFYISPLLGLAVMIIISTAYGWISAFTTKFTLTISSILILLSVIFEKHRTELIRDWLTTSAFSMIATIPILAPIIQFNAFNPFNDSFTYLVHGQWLQSHSFLEEAPSSGYFPAETQVFAYQVAGQRMGASFFLGFVQSMFHLKWSYYTYPATVSTVFTLGSLAIGGIIQQVFPVSRITSLLLCLFPAATMNGFVFGAQYGFFPQTFGLSFAVGLACLIPILLNFTLSEKPSWKKQCLYL